MVRERQATPEVVSGRITLESKEVDEFLFDIISAVRDLGLKKLLIRSASMLVLFQSFFGLVEFV